MSLPSISALKDLIDGREVNNIKRYLEPLIPILVAIAPLYIATEEELAKINWNQYASMFCGIIIPVIIKDIIALFPTIREWFGTWRQTSSLETIEICGWYADHLIHFLVTDPRIIIHSGRYKSSELYAYDINGNKIYSHQYKQVAKFEPYFYFMSKEVYKISIRHSIDSEETDEIAVVKTLESGTTSLRFLTKNRDIVTKLAKWSTEIPSRTVYPYVVSINREGNVSTGPLQPTRGFSSLVVSDETITTLRHAVKQYQDLSYRHKLSLIGFRPKLSILLYGTMGVGKTQLAISLAKELSRDILFVDKENPDRFFKEDIHKLKLNTVVVVFDDIDFWKLDTRHIIGEKDKTETNSTLMRMMELLDGFTIENDAVFVFTTNYVDRFDDALFRPGRINVKLHLTPINCMSMWNKLFNNIYQVTDWNKWFTSQEIDRLCNREMTLSYVVNYLVLPELENVKGFVDRLKSELQ